MNQTHLALFFSAILTITLLASPAMSFQWACSGPIGGAICSEGNTCVELILDGVSYGTLCCSGSCNCSTFRASSIPIASEDALFTALHEPTPTRKLVNPDILPRLSVLLGGREYGPADLRLLLTQNLHFLVTKEGAEQRLIYAFETHEEVLDYLAENSVMPQVEQPGVALPDGSSGIFVYEGADWSGPSSFLPAGLALELSSTWWQGKVSSLRGSGEPTLVTLYEGAGFSGSSITLTTYPFWPRLEVFGWADRAASLAVWPLSPQIPRK